MAFCQKIFREADVVRMESEVNDGVVWLKGLNNDVGMGEMATTNAPHDLSEEVKGAFFGGIVRE